MPPRWTPPATQHHLEEDDPNGTYYRDPNAAAYPRHPIEPVVVSIMNMCPTSPKDIELFACGSTLGNLLRFVQGSDKPFRFLVNVVGPIVHLLRRDKSPLETIKDVRGFGHTFPEANTTWDRDVRGSKSHQRVLQYRLGGINTLIRFEADGYLPSTDDTSSSGQSLQGTEPEDMEALLRGLSVASPSKKPDTDHRDLVVRHGGQVIAQERVFDLKTRSFRSKDKDILGEELPRLWLRQMEHFVLAFHRHHLFEDITVHDIKEKVDSWERSHQSVISSLTGILRDIMLKARAREDGQFEIVYPGSGHLEIREQLADAGQMLSEKVLGEWKAWLEPGNGQDDTEVIDLDGPDGDGGVKLDGSSSEYDVDSDSESGDLTACGIDCGYCGKCSY